MGEDICHREISWRLGGVGLALAAMLSPPLCAQAEAAPVVTPGFTLTVFATPPKGSSKPDSIAVVDGNVWIGYGDGHLPDGSDGLSNEIVEYSPAAKVIRTLSVKGHNDGLRLNPYTKQLWAIQNEDADPKLVVIDPSTGATKKYTFPKTLHGGGYDDVAFINGKAYVSASNPTLDKNGFTHGPAVVSVALNATSVATVTPVLSGRAKAANIPFGTVTALNLTDPDSLSVTPAGDLLMTDQGDAQLVLYRLSLKKPVVEVLPLQGGVQVDDTAFVPATDTARKGFLLISDTGANVTYKLTSKVWSPRTAFSASTGVPAAGKTPAIPGYVGLLDQESGAIFPAVTNMGAPHGVVFVAN